MCVLSVSVKWTAEPLLKPRSLRCWKMMSDDLTSFWKQWRFPWPWMMSSPECQSNLLAFLKVKLKKVLGGLYELVKSQDQFGDRVDLGWHMRKSFYTWSSAILKATVPRPYWQTRFWGVSLPNTHRWFWWGVSRVFRGACQFLFNLETLTPSGKNT